MAQSGADADVLVVGGGPVGLAAAIEARLAGLSVIVCEPRQIPVDKACGEGLMPGAVRALERLGAQPAGMPFVGIRYVDGLTRVDHAFEAGPGLGVRRTVLHQALAERATTLGAEIVSARVTDVRQDVAGVTVDSGLRAGWLLGCDGLHSRLRRAVGVSGLGQRRPPRWWRRPERYGQRRHFQLAPWSEFVEVHWTPSAELYVTPVAEDLVGVAVLGPRGLDYDASVAATPGVAERVCDARVVTSLRGAGPLFQSTVRRVVDRVLLVGDAAGYVDALTGEGIRLGLASARAAVAAIAAGQPERYERAWRRTTRDYRALTTALVVAGSREATRRRIVPLAARLPRVYGATVDRLAE